MYRLPEVSDALDADVPCYRGIVISAKPHADVPVSLRAGVAEFCSVVKGTKPGHSDWKKWMRGRVASGKNDDSSSAGFLP